MSKTPWFSAAEYRPTMAGPFECSTTNLSHRFVAGSAMSAMRDATHMRWWNGHAWSFPLDVDPACYDNIKAPPASHYPSADLKVQYLAFDWRGYNEDQDPL